jgi:hypothetical protein
VRIAIFIKIIENKMVQISPNPNPGTSQINISNNTFFNNQSFENNGYIYIDDKGVLTNNTGATLTNSLLVTLAGNGLIKNHGNFINNTGIVAREGGSVLTSGVFTNSVNSSWISNGYIGVLAGGTMINNGSILADLGSNQIDIYGIFHNQQLGLVTNAQSKIDVYQTLTNSGVINFSEMGKLTVHDDGKLQNSNTINIQDSHLNSTGTVANNIGGHIHVQSGSLILDGIVNNQGIITLDSNASMVIGEMSDLDFNNDGGTINNSGGIISAVDNFFMKSGLNHLSGSQYVNQALVSVDAQTTLNIEQKFYNQDRLASDGVIFLKGYLYNSSNNNQTGVIETNSNSSFYVDGTFENESSLQNSGLIEGNGEIKNASAADIKNNSGASISNNKTFENDGSIINDGDLSNLSGANLINNGVINTTKGKFTNNGTLSGTGKIIGHVNDSGTLSTGNSTGGFTIEGNHYKSGGTTLIELGGTSDGKLDPNESEFDWHHVTGDKIINGGSLEVDLTDDFKLSKGLEFIISRIDGQLIGNYQGLEEGDSVGMFESIYGGSMDLRISYRGGDGNDISLYTDSSNQGLLLNLTNL